MSIQERKLREKQEKRQMILKAAMELLINEGFDNVSTRKIASKIDYSSATIYTYFKDKDAILYELHIIGFDLLYKKQLSIQNISDPLERLCQHGKEYLEFSMEYPEYYEIMFLIRIPSLDFQNSPVWEQGERSYKILKKNVAECKKAGYFKNRESEEVTLTLWSVCHGMVSLYSRRRVILELLDKDYYKNFINNIDSLFRNLIK